MIDVHHKHGHLLREVEAIAIGILFHYHCSLLPCLPCVCVYACVCVCVCVCMCMCACVRKGGGRVMGEGDRGKEEGDGGRGKRGSEEKRSEEAR